MITQKCIVVPKMPFLLNMRAESRNLTLPHRILFLTISDRRSLRAFREVNTTFQYTSLVALSSVQVGIQFSSSKFICTVAFFNIATLLLNKPGTAQVGAISKAQK